MRNLALILSGLLLLNLSCAENGQSFGETEITKWQYGRAGAVSLTYDDGIKTQFTEAMPVMDSLGFPGTFYIITGEMEGSAHPPKFIGRPLEEIIQDTKTIPTGEDNFFERASALQYPGYDGTYEWHRNAYSAYTQENIQEAYAIVDEAYSKIRAGEFEPGENINPETAYSAEMSWDDLRSYAEQGHEFGSHTVSHPGLAVLDEPNMLYELEKSKEDILNQMGPEHTYSMEGPFGVSDPRAMEYLLSLYPAPRNVMPDPYLEVLLRGSSKAPGTSDKDYVQWQKGPLSATPLSEMKSWVDTVLANDHIWLILVFHGVDDVGWEPVSSEDMAAYFNYIKEREDDLWVATFRDVTKYVRERMDAEVSSEEKENKLNVSLTHSLDEKWYKVPLTLKTAILSPDWESVMVKQGEREEQVQVMNDENSRYILYQALPNAGPVTITEM